MLAALADPVNVHLVATYAFTIRVAVVVLAPVIESFDSGSLTHGEKSKG